MRTRTALTYGAVLGREFTAALVARMQETLPARIIDTVLPALRAGLITEVELGRGAIWSPPELSFLRGPNSLGMQNAYRPPDAHASEHRNSVSARNCHIYR